MICLSYSADLFSLTALNVILPSTQAREIHSMRLWSIHPSYLDARGLVALWREALLAQHVLLGKTRGYRHHPQLLRFRNTTNPEGAIATYLRFVADEAERRGYHFDRSKIIPRYYRSLIPVNSGQLNYEFQHLLVKLKTRDPVQYEKLQSLRTVKTHPLLEKIRGPVEAWEVIVKD